MQEILTNAAHQFLDYKKHHVLEFLLSNVSLLEIQESKVNLLCFPLSSIKRKVPIVNYFPLPKSNHLQR